MNVEERIKLIKEVGKEIVKEDELRQLLEKEEEIIAYDGFEPSGTNIHIAQGLLRAINVNKLTTAGIKFKFLVADWHAWANNKMDGNLENIQKVGKYLIEVWKACDMDFKNVEFVWASELLNNRDYWKTVMEIARNSTVKRIIRCSQIMGRNENDSLQSSQILYPCMQCADIFHLGAKITQLGMDQRKVNVLAREIGEKLGYWKPIIISHHMLMGLNEPPKTENAEDRAREMKMSKSNPDSAIFMDDTEDDIKKKIKKAYCPEGIIKENPILEYNKYILFEKFETIKIKRPEKFGGDIKFNNYEDMETAFQKKEVHPMDLKTATSTYLNQLIEPIRTKLKNNKVAQKLKEEISSFKVTR